MHVHRDRRLLLSAACAVTVQLPVWVNGMFHCVQAPPSPKTSQRAGTGQAAPDAMIWTSSAAGTTIVAPG